MRLPMNTSISMTETDSRMSFGTLREGRNSRFELADVTVNFGNEPAPLAMSSKKKYSESHKKFDRMWNQRARSSAAKEARGEAATSVN